MATKFSVTVDEGDAAPQLPPVPVSLVGRDYVAYCPKDGVWVRSVRLYVATGEELDEIVWYFVLAAFEEDAYRELRARIADTRNDPLRFLHILEVVTKLAQHWLPQLSGTFQALGIDVNFEEPTPPNRQTRRRAAATAPKPRSRKATSA